MSDTFGLQHQQRHPGSTSSWVWILGRVRGFGERVGTYAGWAMSVEVKIVENLEVAGCSSDDARGGGVRKRMRRKVRSWEDCSLVSVADNGCAELLWKADS